MKVIFIFRKSWIHNTVRKMQLSLFDNLQQENPRGFGNPEGLKHLETKQLLYDLFQAYYDARRNKRNTYNQLKFEINYESELFKLHDDIITKKYELKPSTCFVTFDPVQREIFAADFRDRIVHHLIYNYISPVFERVFINDSYSCRIGKGTSYGIERADYFMRACSQNYTKDCYILKLDIQGYFMAINRTILYDKVIKTLSKFHNTGKEQAFDYNTVIWLLEKIIFNNPVENCIIKGKNTDWNGLPASKSLFQSAKNCGLPIGNLTSQLFSNIYLNDFDSFIKHTLKCKYYGRYVDDFVIVNTEKEFLKSIIPIISEYLQNKLQLTLHPKKIYLQHYTKGLKFLGVVIKPHRIYIANRTKGNFYQAIEEQNKIIRGNKSHKLTTEEKTNTLSTVNSYLGITKHYKTYRLRKKMLNKNLSVLFFNYFYISKKYCKLVSKIKKK